MSQHHSPLPIKLDLTLGHRDAQYNSRAPACLMSTLRSSPAHGHPHLCLVKGDPSQWRESHSKEATSCSCLNLKVLRIKSNQTGTAKTWGAVMSRFQKVGIGAGDMDTLSNG